MSKISTTLVKTMLLNVHGLNHYIFIYKTSRCVGKLLILVINYELTFKMNSDKNWKYSIISNAKHAAAQNIVLV